MKRNSLYALIETGCATLGFDDDLKRDVFFTVTGQRSKRDMDEHQLVRVVEHLRARGFDEQNPTKKKRLTQFDYLRLLWAKLKAAGLVQQDSVQALDAWVATQTAHANGGIGISSHKMLTVRQARAMIERLKQWLGRK